MSSGPVTALTGPPAQVPVFPIPKLSMFTLEVLEKAGLREFYELNVSEFKSLVAVLYVGFMEQSDELRKKKPNPEKLYKLFCSHVYVVLTAANPQAESLRLDPPKLTEENGIAREFLWNHMRREDVLTWQDFYSETKRKNPKAEALVHDFVQYIVNKAFADDTAGLIADKARLTEARRVVQEINRGKKKLRSI